MNYNKINNKMNNKMTNKIKKKKKATQNMKFYKKQMKLNL